MRSVLDALNSALEALTSGMSDPIRTSLARELLSAAASAYERVLLDGGPCRWFTVQEAPLLLRDLGALQELFEAEGEGLDEWVGWGRVGQGIEVGTSLAQAL
jgi:hypothetical protein